MYLKRRLQNLLIKLKTCENFPQMSSCLPFLCLIPNTKMISLWLHRITEYPEMEGTHEDHWAHLLAPRETTLKASCISESIAQSFLNSGRLAAVITALGSPFQDRHRALGTLLAQQYPKAADSLHFCKHPPHGHTGKPTGWHVVLPTTWSLLSKGTLTTNSWATGPHGWVKRHILPLFKLLDQVLHSQHAGK